MGRKKRELRLQVLLNSQPVGVLSRQAGGEVQFKYLPSWLENPEAVHISNSLHLRENTYIGPSVTSYFDNLLPDNDDIRERLSARVNAESSAPLDLLAEIGRDCVGALQIIPEGLSLTNPDRIEARKLNDSEIAEILRTVRTALLGWCEKEISGYQSPGRRKRRRYLNGTELGTNRRELLPQATYSSSPWANSRTASI